MNVGVIGQGAIGRYVLEQLSNRGIRTGAIVVRPQRLENSATMLEGQKYVASAADLPDDIDCMIDCAGHRALAEHGPAILRGGTDLITVSIGGLADATVHQSLLDAANEGQSQLLLATGAVGALDALRAARIGALKHVTYIGRKPPAGWKGSPAETQFDLDAPMDKPRVHFDGAARRAALDYPKNANVAAAVALAGIGFDETRVKLIADPTVEHNVHEISAEGDFGRFSFEIRGRTLPDNPKSSALAAMSAVSALIQKTSGIRFT